MLQHQSLIAPDFLEQPYWWNLAPPDRLPVMAVEGAYDVVIVGSGITGLRTAVDLARAGLKVVVCDREDAGYGASRRNAGFLGRTLKKSYTDLERRYGAEYARRVYGELHAAYETTLDFIGKEGLKCYANRCGRFIAATSAVHLDRLVADSESMQQALGFDYRVVATKDIAEEMGTSGYFGGVVVPDLGSLHPGLYHKGLLDLALAAGVTVSSNADVLSIERDSLAHYRVATSAGRASATHVVVATNGYTPRHLRWHARRVIPFTGYMAVTEELPPKLMSELIPNGRTIVDTNFNVDFFRPAPDARRLLFGGSTGLPLRGRTSLVERMHGLVSRVYPQLRTVRLSAVWSGKCAATFDMMPHMGSHNGLWYGLGYNFAGVPMGSYFGMKIAQGILRGAPEDSIFCEVPFKTMPFYGGTPWFVPLAMRVFAWRDRWAARLKD